MKNLILIAIVAGVFTACSSTDSSTINDAQEVAEASAQSTTYVIDAAASSMLWHGEKITGDNHNGTVNVSSGDISLTDGVITAGHFSIDMASISTTDEMPEDYVSKLEGHLRGADFFNAEDFPTAKFEVSSSTADTLIGNLTIKGITHTISIPYSLSTAGENVEAHSEFAIDRARWDVRYGSGSFFKDLGDNLIKDEITFKVNLIGSRS